MTIWLLSTAQSLTGSSSHWWPCWHLPHTLNLVITLVLLPQLCQRGWEVAGITSSAWPCCSFKDHTASAATTAEVFGCFSLFCQKRQLGHIGRTFSNRTPGLQSYTGSGWLTKMLSPFHFYETKEDHPNHYSIILWVLSKETRILLHRLQIRDHGFNSTAVLNRMLYFSAEAFRSLTSCTLGIQPIWRELQPITEGNYPSAG